MIPHLAQSDIVTASYSTFWHFWTFFGHFLVNLGGQNAPQGGGVGGVKKNFSLKVVFYLDNSNDTSFSPIGHRGDELLSIFNVWRTDGRTDRPTDTSRCRVVGPRLKRLDLDFNKRIIPRHASLHSGKRKHIKKGYKTYTDVWYNKRTPLLGYLCT